MYKFPSTLSVLVAYSGSIEFRVQRWWLSLMEEWWKVGTQKIDFGVKTGRT